MRTLIVAEGKHERSGALHTIVARLASRDMQYDHDRIGRSDIHAHHGKGPGYFKKAVRWLLEAAKREYDALILVIDEDGHPERVQQIDKAQQTNLAALPRAFGVAIRTFDAWMLADEQALTSVLDHRVKRQPNPEGIRNPKSVCEQLRDEGKREVSLTDMYASFAEAADINALEERCPRGFRPFAQRVRSL